MLLTRKQITEQLKQFRNKQKTVNWLISNTEVTVKNTLLTKTMIRHGTDCVCCGAKLVGAVLSKAYAPNRKDPYPVLTFYAKTVEGKLIEMTCDHIIPKSRGGQKVNVNNMQPMCKTCNAKKGNMLPSELIFGKNYLKIWLSQMNTGQLVFEEI